MYYFVARLVFLLLVCVIIGVKGRHHRHHHRRHNASQEQAQRRDNLGFLRSFTAENLHFSKLFSDKLTNGSPRTKVSHRMPAWQKHHTKAFRSNDDDDTSFDDDELAEIKRNSKEKHFITSESRIHHTKDFETEEPSETTQPYIDALSDHKDTALMEARGKSSKAEEGSAASSGDDEGSSSAAYQVNKEPPIPHKTHQGVMDTSQSSPASSQSPMEDLPANIPVPPMIPLPLFYNSGEEETSTSATVDVKPTSELEDGVGESGNGEYTPPTRQKQMEADDWVDRLLKEDQKSKGFDEDDAFDGEEDEEEEEEANVANKPQQQQQSTSQVATQQVAAKVANNNAQKPASNNNNVKQQSNTGISSVLWNSQQMPQQNNNINNNNNNGFQQVPDFYQKPVIQQYPQQQNNMAQSNNNNFNMQNNNVVPTGNSNNFGNNNNFNSNNMMNNNGFIPNSNMMNGNNNNFLNNNNLLNNNNMNNNNLMANNNMMKNNWNNNFNNNNNLNNNNMNYFNKINNNNMMNKNTERDNTLAAKNVAPTLTQNFAAPIQTNNTSFVEQESVCMIGCPSTCSPSCDPECCSKNTEVAEAKEESGVHYPSPLILPEVQRSQPIGATSVVPSDEKPSNIQAPFMASSTQSMSMVQSFVAPSTNQAFNNNYNAGKVEGQENNNPAPVEFNLPQKSQISLQPVRPFQLKLPFFQNVVHMRKPVQETQDTTEVKYPNPGPVCAKGCLTNCLPHCTNYCCGVASKRQAIQRSRISTQ